LHVGSIRGIDFYNLLGNSKIIEKGNGPLKSEWSVLDWNQPAIDFYVSIGAEPQDEWVRYRMEGANLIDFASSKR